MRHQTMMPRFAAVCLPTSTKADLPVTARSLRLGTGRHNRRIRDLLKSPTAIGYAARTEHDKSPGTFGSGRITTKGHGMAPLTIATASMAADAHRGIHGHRPTA